MMRHFLRFFGWIFSLACILGAIGAALVGIVIWRFSEQLPDYSQLATYQPAVTTRIHATDGSLLAEYSRERRLFLPNDAIPERVKQAFIAAEDKNFYKHPGVDIEGVARAAVYFFKRDNGKRPQGASTITQQVAKNFLLSSETSFSRKIKEMLVALRMEETYSKERILELYLNEIYLGLSNYGVAAAALNYFGKGVNELTLPETAYLAALPKGPNNYHPYRAYDAAIDRRNYVIDRMVENGFVSREEGDRAKKTPLGVQLRQVTPNTIAAGFFAEEVRRELAEKYGEKGLYEGGLSVRATLDPSMQVMMKPMAFMALSSSLIYQPWNGGRLLARFRFWAMSNLGVWLWCSISKAIMPVLDCNQSAKRQVVSGLIGCWAPSRLTAQNGPKKHPSNCCKRAMSSMSRQSAMTSIVCNKYPIFQGRWWRLIPIQVVSSPWSVVFHLINRNSTVPRKLCVSQAPRLNPSSMPQL